MEDGDSFSLILAEISLPYLRRRLEEAGSGRVPFMEPDDVPAWLRPEGTCEDAAHADGRARERWTYILGEMVWAMEATLDWHRRMDRHVVDRGEAHLVPSPDRPGSYDVNVVRPGTVDSEGLRNDGERLREGHRLFARYVRAI